LSKHFFSAFIIGSATFDHVDDYPHLNAIPDGKEDATHTYNQAGGGCVNALKALEIIAKHFKCGTQMHACLPLGKNSIRKDFVMAALGNADLMDIAYLNNSYGA
jgi:hypothetical protein